MCNLKRELETSIWAQLTESQWHFQILSLDFIYCKRLISNGLKFQPDLKNNLNQQLNPVLSTYLEEMLNEAIISFAIILSINDPRICP